MLNEKQFRERAIRELREIAKRVQGLQADRALYLKLESEVIGANSSLAESASPYLTLFRAAYTDATTMRLRRLFALDADLSLRRLVAQFSDYHDICLDKLTDKELSTDRGELEGVGTILKEQMEAHFSAHERTTAALATANRELDRAIDLLADCVKRYYWIVSDSYIEVEPSPIADPLAVFRNPWILPD